VGKDVGRDDPADAPFESLLHGSLLYRAGDQGLQGEESLRGQGEGIRSRRATSGAKYASKSRGEVGRCFVERFVRVLIAANAGIESRGVAGEDR
jgi:hypothetical protein